MVGICKQCGDRAELVSWIGDGELCSITCAEWHARERYRDDEDEGEE